ncbi:MAG: hypothetical protein IPN77_33290 [Sandaracinaceae bacterium]|nr:hypothetical protein [Sandaracinaceae bacterium]
MSNPVLGGPTRGTHGVQTLQAGAEASRDGLIRSALESLDNAITDRGSAPG